MLRFEVALVIIFCEDSCNECKKRFLKDDDCLGDYTDDGVLLRYCPQCGKMYPYLSVTYYEKPGLSNRERKRAGTRIAKEHRLDYRDMAYLVKTTKIEDMNVFASQLSKKILASFNIDIKKEEVLNAI